MVAIRALLKILVILSALGGQPALASNVVADVDRIAESLTRAGYNPQLSSNAGERFIKAQLNGYEFLVLPYGCDEAERNCRSVQFFIAFDPANSPSLEAMNAYSRENRWGRVYLDQDGDPALEFDLDLEKGGMSEALFLDNVAYWEAIVQSYAKFVFGKE